ncbi:Hint domain-containing protein [Actibacterium sp. 188UL27-1]|uniref:Hint domain-containing protein n=1 Tax=Actibacterium sp. 188UL27-1 TaxID=2786961 RepID=UPI001958DC96|nr:Hint domain-containing protein [Actibacterium sp. 188UL27-1]MBM7067621.1 Hint domain-containing protein [Actibacterium sp. 188UL27-1]
MGYVDPGPRGADTASVEWLEPVGGRAGLLGGTLVETAQGWRRVENLKIGTSVYTYDGGLRPIMRLQRRMMRNNGSMVVRLPGGQLNVCQDLFVLANQHVMVGWDGLFAFAHGEGRLCQARQLCGVAGIGPVHFARSKGVVCLTFAEEELIYANTGALVHCPGVLGEGIATNYFPVVRATDKVGVELAKHIR